MENVDAKLCSWVIVAAASLGPALGGAQELPRAAQKPAAAKEAPSDKPAAYVPPMRGSVAQVRRVGGATRGWGDVEVPLTVAIAPDHVGLTSDPSPTLYWYLAGPTRFQVVVTVIADDAVAPLIEREVKPDGVGGFHRFALREQGVALEPDTDYEWTVAIVIDPLERSRDVIAQGAIRRVEGGLELKAAPQGPGNADLGMDYARAGLFYDAFDALCQAIQSRPELERPRAMRRALLEQIALPEVAAIDAESASGK